MKLSTKVRLATFIAFFFLSIIVIVGESSDIFKGVEPVIVFIVFILLVVFFVRLKCEKCGCSVYQGGDKRLVRSPYSYILFKGKCPCCTK